MATLNLEYCSPIAGGRVTVQYNDSTHTIDGFSVLPLEVCSEAIPQPLYQHIDGGNVYTVQYMSIEPWASVSVTGDPVDPLPDEPVDNVVTGKDGQDILEYYWRVWNVQNTTQYNFAIFRNVVVYDPDTGKGDQEITGVNAELSNEDQENGEQWGVLKSDVNLHDTIEEYDGIDPIGMTIWISNTSSGINHGRWLFCNSYEFDDAEPTYKHIYKFNNRSFYPETILDFDVMPAYSLNVSSFDTVTKYGEETDASGEDLSGKFDGIMPSYTDVNIFDETGFDYEDIFLADVGSYKLRIYEGYRNWSTVHWCGTSMSDVFNRQLFNQEYYTTIRFIDGFNHAKNRRFWIEDTETSPTLLSLLQWCLTKGCINPLNIRENVNIYHAEHNDDYSDSPLTQKTLDIAVWFSDPDATFYDVIENIVKQFGCRLFLYKGAWILQRINELSGEYYLRTWDTTNQLTSHHWIAVNPIAIDAAYGEADSNFIDSAPKAKSVRLESANEYPYNTRYAGNENPIFEMWTDGQPDGYDWRNWDNMSLATYVPEIGYDSDTGRKTIIFDKQNDPNDVCLRNINPVQFASGIPHHIEEYEFEIGVKIVVSDGGRMVGNNPYNYTDLKYIPWKSGFPIQWSAFDFGVSNANYWWCNDGVWREISDLLSEAGQDLRKNEVLVSFNPLDPSFTKVVIDDVDFSTHPNPNENTFFYLIPNVSPANGIDQIIIDRILIRDPNVPSAYTDTYDVPGDVRGVQKVAAPRTDNVSNPLIKGNGNITIEIEHPIDEDGGWYVRDDSREGLTGYFKGQGSLLSVVNQEHYEELKERNRIANGTFLDDSINFLYPISLEGERYIPLGVEHRYHEDSYEGQWIQLVSAPKYFKL